jgi:hypothetical protein
MMGAAIYPVLPLLSGRDINTLPDLIIVIFVSQILEKSSLAVIGA